MPHNSSNPLRRRIRVLALGDSPTATTGFGRVNRHILEQLDPEKYKIDWVGINYNAAPLEVMRGMPYQSRGWRLFNAAANRSDPLGRQMFADMAVYAVDRREPYDVLWLHNDLSVLASMAQPLQEGMRERCQVAGVAFYCPLDFELRDRLDLVAALPEADFLATYTWWAKNEIESVSPVNMQVIPLGNSPDWCYRASPKDIEAFRTEFLEVTDPDTFIVSCVSRNQHRKDMPRLIEAFARFNAEVPNSLLYLHCHFKDVWCDLSHVVSGLGLRGKVKLPHHEHANGVLDDKFMRELYSSSHLYISLSQGEGWGLGASEAMACGTPVALALNTAAHDLLGARTNPDEVPVWLHERGLGIASGQDFRQNDEPDLWHWDQDAIRRPLANIGHAVLAMKYTYIQYGSPLSQYHLKGGKLSGIVESGRKWATGTLSWARAAASWDKVFTEFVAARVTGQSLPKPIRGNGA